MRRLLVTMGVGMGIAIIGLWLGSPAHLHGQQMTEIFIPLGQSPGVSGKTSLIGEIESAQAEKRTLVVAGPSGSQAVVLTDRTKIWLDRTLVNLSNQTGTRADLQKGRKVEVKYREADQKRVAEWIKVQVTKPSAPSPAGPR